QVTPPVGFNLFVLQGLTGRNIFQIAWAALPFFGVLVLGLLLICLFPEIATYLPDRMSRR
ncbi:MAG TPA: TRAP transporter large permease subunit, partial [Gammaproteobacteria bacterium]|nr:TRAP transporter large permease subunit [Gammaproteobacteria bacterium]